MILNLKRGLKLSAILDKMELEVKTTKVNKDGETVMLTQKELGADLIMQALKKAHKAENEICAFVADVKKCTVEEAAEIDIIAFFKNLFSDVGTIDFLKSAVKSKAQES
jgi:hypothetical protein